MIFLQKYLPSESQYGQYVFDTESKAHILRYYQSEKDAAQPVSGFADERDVGLIRRRRIFVAIFFHNESLQFLIDGISFKLSDKFNIQRKNIFPCVKRFVILLDSVPTISFSYTFCDNYDFPGPLMFDIFLYLAEQMSTEVSRERTSYWWRARAAGRNVTTNQFFEEVEQHLANIFGKQSGK